MSEPQDGPKPPTVSTSAAPSSGSLIELEEQVVSVTYEGRFSGPLPPPGTLQAYDRVLPGLAERIVGSWEKESVHRRGIESRDMRLAEWGQRGAFVLALAFLASGIGLVVAGFEPAGIAVLFTAIAGLVTAFIVDRKASKREPDDQDD